MVLNNGKIKFLSLYNGIDKQCVKVRLLYSVITLDQKSSGSSPDGATTKPASLAGFLFCDGRARQGIPPCGMTKFRDSGKFIRRSRQAKVEALTEQQKE
jgi:hypothetical protein